MIELLTWLEDSALGQAVRGAGVWSYAAINLAHILGVATLFGSILLLDLRLMGIFGRVGLADLAPPAVRLATLGFILAATSGLCLLATNATEYRANPFLLLKFGAILMGLANALVLHRMPAWRGRRGDSASRRERLQLGTAGAVSLASWTTALAAGRMLGYW